MIRKRLFLLIIVFVVLVVTSFSIVYYFLATSNIPEAGDFCETWGRAACQQAGNLSDNWEIELDLKEGGFVVRKSCLDFLKCNSCQDCGFL